MASYDYTQVLRDSTVPVLLLQGEKDNAINREIDKRWPFLKDNPLVQRKRIKDAGHIINYDQPRAFYRTLIQFFEEPVL